MHIRRLRFEDIAPRRAFHAALVESSLSGKVLPHCHDFCEVLLVLKGEGRHLVNGDEQILEPGVVLFVRPDDAHSFRAARARELCFVNVAFPLPAWESIVVATALEGEWTAWRQAKVPPTGRVPLTDRQTCEGAAFRAVQDFHAGGGPLHLTRFLTSILPVLTSREETSSIPACGPDWLDFAMGSMQHEENLYGGLPRFVELAGVSLPHLCRTMRSRTGKTPSEFVNDLRMRQSATMLTTTRMEIREIVAACGMENVSYFYRQFRKRYESSPQEFRRREQRRLA